MPLLARRLDASVAQTQSTFYALILAFGCSQLAWGPASDRLGPPPHPAGRHWPVCAGRRGLRPGTGMDALIAWRTVQGAALRVMVMAARAIVSDLYNPVEGTHVMSKALSGLGRSGLLQPLDRQLAGAAHRVGAPPWWPSRSWVLPPGCWCGCAFRKACSASTRTPCSPGACWATGAEILRHPTFLAYSATTSPAYGGLVVF